MCRILAFSFLVICEGLGYKDVAKIDAVKDDSCVVEYI